MREMSDSQRVDRRIPRSLARETASKAALLVFRQSLDPTSDSNLMQADFVIGRRLSTIVHLVTIGNSPSHGKVQSH
jgi:hypothetical protein